MSSNIFKISAVAATIAASFGAHAAIYNVYGAGESTPLYAPTTNTSETYGVAVESSVVNCWTTSDCNNSSDVDHEADLKLAYEEKFAAEGFNYRDESPFLMVTGYDYVLEEGYSGFDNYCNSFLEYADSICTKWADKQYTHGYMLETTQNSSDSYVEGTATKVQNGQKNVIVNGFTSGAANAFGTYYGGSLENRTTAYFEASPIGLGSAVQSKVFAKNGNTLVGSVSFQSGSNINDYYSQAAIWDASSPASAPTLISLGDPANQPDRDMSFGSFRDTSDVTDTGIGVINYAIGFNSKTDHLPLAVAYDITNSKLRYVSSYDDDEKYANSKLTSLSSSGIAIGEVKHIQTSGGAKANQLFYVDMSTGGNTENALTPVTFSSRFGSTIFFSGANGKAGAINDKNEVVGQIDYERHQESNNGKPRARRAFIATLSTNIPERPTKNNTAWYLDDLTYGGSDINEYRIIDATDINDAGVIAGTAYYCAGGYATEAIDASCSGDLSVVAVKLVPINGATSADIQTRPVIEETIERQGASLGFLALTLLGFLGFRRK